MKTRLVVLIALALPPLLAAAVPPAAKVRKVHAVSLATGPAAAASRPAQKVRPAQPRMPQQAPDPVETVYDYASCGCF